MDKKALVQKYRGAVSFLCGVHNAPSRLAVHSRGKGNRVIAPCVVGSGAIVTGPHPGENQVLAGVPAKIVKTGINWDIRRLPVEPEIQGE